MLLLQCGVVRVIWVVVGIVNVLGLDDEIVT